MEEETSPVNKNTLINSGNESGKFTEKMRSNPWMMSTLVLGVMLLVLVFFTFSGGITGSTISSSTAGENLVKFLNQQAPSEVTLKDVSTESGLYKINVLYQDQVIPVYMTKDGKYMASIQPISMTGDATQKSVQDVPKTDKPKVELYVFTYCPYGLQMEKAFDSVVKLLGNKIDFKIRQIGAMHGEYEQIEAERQLCIEKNYPNKFLTYVNEFALDTAIGACGSDTSCSLTKVNALMAKLGIDSAKIDACMKSEGKALYSAEEKNAEANGVSGSPTTMINGVEVALSRTPEAIKTAICEAFKTKPSECSQTLSTTAASAGFGAGSGSSSSTASC